MAPTRAAGRSFYNPQPKNLTNFWYLINQFVFQRGFIRIPLMLGIPMAWKVFIEPTVEENFKALNVGHSQVSNWDAVTARTKERLAAEEAEE